MKRIFSFGMVLVLMCVMFSQVAAVELAVAQSKISPDLMSEFNSRFSKETILAHVNMTDVDHKAVMEEFARRYPQEYSVYMEAKFGGTGYETTDAEELILQQAIELKRKVYREFYAELNQNLLDDYLDADAQVYVSEYAPMAIVELDRDTALAMARCDDVVSFSNVRIADLPITDSGFPNGLTSLEVIGHLELSNEISRADYLRDTKHLTGSGIKIGILEYYAVPDITNTYLQSASITIRSGDEVVVNESEIHHPTVIAMILAAEDPDGTMHGIVPDAQLYCARFFTTGDSSDDFVGMCSDIEWMISNGVNIINASFGIESDSLGYDAIAQWVDHIATVHDVHFVAAAGNDLGYVATPGTAYNAITVGGYKANGSDDVTGFTSYPTFGYIEVGQAPPEKPNLVANAYFGDYIHAIEGIKEYRGTSFSAPQVTGVIAQLCCWNGNLKYRQNVVGAVLAASSAEKVDSVGNGLQGDVYGDDAIWGSNQISNREGAGILDARWAWGILANQNYWNLKLEAEDFPYEKTVTINCNVHTLTRVAIFWTKNNTDINHTTNELGTNNQPLPNLNLYVYDSNGNLIASSTSVYSNFEIVQFVPTAPGIYTIRITGSTDSMEYVGLALW